MGKKQKRKERYKRVVWRHENRPGNQERVDNARERAKRELKANASLPAITKLTYHKLGLRMS